MPEQNYTDEVSVLHTVDQNVSETYGRRDILEIISRLDAGQVKLRQEYIKETQFYDFISEIRNYFISYSDEYEKDSAVAEINKYIKKLLYMMCNAAIAGSELSTSAAISGISIGISIQNDILYVRSIYPDTFEQYMESCRQYFDCFVMLTSISKRVDEVRYEIQNYKMKLDEKEQNYRKTLGRLEACIINDKSLISEIVNFKECTYNNSSQLWSRKVHELYNSVVDLKIQQFNIKYERFCLDTEEMELHKNNAIREQLLSTLNTKPNPDSVDIQKMGEVYQGVLAKSKKANEDFSQLFERMKEMNREMDDINL